MAQRTYIYLLYNTIYYDSLYKEYYNILTLNKQPEGALKTHTKVISINKQSTNDFKNSICAYALSNNLANNHNIANKYSSNLLTLEDLNEFTEFIINNNYEIIDSITLHNISINNSSTNNSNKVIYSFKITL
jgi:hypothetical protein